MFLFRQDLQYRIFRISICFHHFPDENDEAQSRKAEKKAKKNYPE